MPNFSGKWNLDGQLRGVKQGTWTGIPFELPYGELYAWGQNSNGQSGLDDTTSRSSPVQVGAVSTWEHVAVARNISFNGHAFAVKEDGTLWAWGLNANGQLGQNDTTSRSSPVQMGSETDWSSTALGVGHVLAVTQSNELYSIGFNNAGQLGHGDTVAKSSPVQIGALANWAVISAFGNVSYSIKTDGTLWAWGNDEYGMLAQGVQLVNKSSPVQVGALTNWATISAGYNHSMAVKTDGTLWGWGRTQKGKLGNNQNNNFITYSSPIQIGSDTDWGSVSCGTDYTFAIKTDGALYAFGDNANGELGLGDAVDKSSPVQVGALTNWDQAVPGSALLGESFAIKTDGTLWAWGGNSNGQLGFDDTVNRSSPVQVGSETNWRTVASGSANALATTTGIGRTGMS